MWQGAGHANVHMVLYSVTVYGRILRFILLSLDKGGHDFATAGPTYCNMML